MNKNKIRELARSVLGQWQWTPPAWVGRATSVAKSGANLVKTHPRRSAGIFGAVLLVSVGSWLGWRWYQSLPKPVEFSVSVAAPERTCIECDPPGKPNPAVLTFSGSVAPIELAGKGI